MPENSRCEPSRSKFKLTMTPSAVPQKVSAERMTPLSVASVTSSGVLVLDFDYGGPVPTVLPGSQSLAFDSGGTAVCPPLDALGEPRDEDCDTGAAERQPDDPESGPFFADGFESGDTGAWASGP